MAQSGTERVVVYLGGTVASRLRERAARERRSVSATGAFLLERALADEGAARLGEGVEGPVDATAGVRKPVSAPAEPPPSPSRVAAVLDRHFGGDE